MITISMEMPTSCCHCHFRDNNLGCVASFSIKGKPIFFDSKSFKEEPFNICNERHPRCPLNENDKSVKIEEYIEEARKEYFTIKDKTPLYISEYAHGRLRGLLDAYYVIKGE